MTVPKKFAALILAIFPACFWAPAQQKPNAVPPPWEIAPAPSPKPVEVIYLNRDCALLPDPSRYVPGTEWQLEVHPELCHLETVLNSRHDEETVVGDERKRCRIDIREHEYVLQNESEAPVLFVVAHAVPKKWTVDSDPQPVTYVGPIAVFKVNAAPGEVVRLHVGMRHVSHEHSKRIK